MAANDRIRHTVEEYFEIERTRTARFEYDHGDIVAVAGASKPHNVIMMNCGASLHAQVRHRDCFVYTADMRVRVSAERYIYPDIAIVCGKEQIDPSPLDTLLNPTVLIEVLSTSTEDEDLTGKARAFRAMPSLQEYLFISQKEIYIEHFHRDNARWILTEYVSLNDVIVMDSVLCTLTLADVYEKVAF